MPKPKHPVEEMLDYYDFMPIRLALARVDAATFTKPDGTKWLDAKKLFGPKIEEK
jgi:hypothetical protein